LQKNRKPFIPSHTAENPSICCLWHKKRLLFFITTAAAAAATIAGYELYVGFHVL